MSATKTDICNLSQLILGQALLTNVDTDTTKAGTIYRTLFPLARDEALRSYPWSCAAKRTILRSEAAIQDNPKQQAINGMVWVPVLALWVAVGASDGTRPYIITSPDSIVWTQVTTASTAVNADLMGVATDGVTIVMVGKTVGGTPLIFTTTDLSTFTQITVAQNVQLNEICSYGLGKFCAVGNAVSTTRPYVVYSTNSGATFTQATNAGLSLNGNLYDVIWTGSLLVAVGAPVGGVPMIVTAADPSSTWTHQTTGLVDTVALNAVGWNGARLVAVGAANAAAPITYTCDDAGITWVPQANVAKAIALNSLAWGNGAWVGVGQPDTTTAASTFPNGTFMVSSLDGVTWTGRILQKNLALNTIEFGSTYFAMGGAADGGQAYLLSWAGPPPFDYAFSWALPPGWMRVYDVDTGQKDYKIEDGQLLYAGQYPKLRYTKQQTDITRFDALFSKALAAQLAIFVCQPIGAAESKLQLAQARWEHTLAEARSTDAIEDGRDPQRDDEWIEYRRQGGTGWPNLTG